MEFFLGKRTEIALYLTMYFKKANENFKCWMPALKLVN